MDIRIDKCNAENLLERLVAAQVPIHDAVYEYKDKEPFFKEMKLKWATFSWWKKFWYFEGQKLPDDYERAAHYMCISGWSKELEYYVIRSFVSQKAADDWDHEWTNLQRVNKLINRMSSLMYISEWDSDLVTIGSCDADAIQSFIEDTEQ